MQKIGQRVEMAGIAIRSDSRLAGCYSCSSSEHHDACVPK